MKWLRLMVDAKLLAIAVLLIGLNSIFSLLIVKIFKNSQLLIQLEPTLYSLIWFSGISFSVLLWVVWQLKKQIKINQILIQNAARTEQQLLQANLASILERITDAFVALDRDWNYTYVNERAGENFNRRPEDLIGKNIWEEFPEGVGQKFYHAYHQAVAEQRMIQIEEYYSPWDRWFENRIYPSQEGLLIFFQDITPRKRAELELIKSEQRYRSLVEASAQVVWLANPDGDIFTATENWTAITGLPCDELVKQNWLNIMHPEDRDRVTQVWNQAVTAQQICEVEYRLKTIDGAYRHFLARGVPVLEADGHLREWVGMLTDITESKQVQLALEQSQQQLQDIIDNASAVIYAKDLEGRLFLVNRSLERLLNLPRQEIVGKTDDELFTSELAAQFRANDSHMLENRTQQTHKEDSQNGDIYLSTKFPLLDTKGEPYALCGFSINISDRKRAEAALRQAKETLEMRVNERTAELSTLNTQLAEELLERRRAEQELQILATKLERSNQELEQFAYAASHDLQEPLRAVSGYAQLLVQEYQSVSSDAEEYIGYIVDGATRMRQLIQDLLTYSRVGSRDLNLISVNCNEVFQQALLNLKVAIAESNAHISVEPLPTISADQGRLIQLFQNLLGNAIKFRRAVPIEVKAWAELKGNDWMFSIQDNGIGIKEEYLERIFAIFKRLHTRREFPGTGIGLALCKKIVERHGGQIWADSQPGVGTTFRFTLPTHIPLKTSETHD